MNPPDWLGPAQDCLKERGLDDAARWLEMLPEAIKQLEIAVGWVSQLTNLSAEHHSCGPMLRLIAEASGETVEATVERLRPKMEPIESGVSPSGQSRWFRFNDPAMRGREIPVGLPPAFAVEVSDGALPVITINGISATLLQNPGATLGWGHVAVDNATQQNATPAIPDPDEASNP